MSYPSTRIGGHAFNHDQSPDAEREYDRLRDDARAEHSKYQHCAAESRKAYERGDGARAHELSEEGKGHAAKADEYNKQASDYIFRENNAVGRVDSDTIDLHGQFVEEAEEIVKQRIAYAKQNGQTHLHVIVGKGNHSANHVQKIKPAVEDICRELGLNYTTEHNEGRIYVDLTGGDARPPTGYSQSNQNTAQFNGRAPKPHAGQQNNYPGQQQQQQQQQQQPQQEMDYEEMARKNIPKIVRLLRSCCTVM